MGPDAEPSGRPALRGLLSDPALLLRVLSLIFVSSYFRAFVITP